MYEVFLWSREVSQLRRLVDGIEDFDYWSWFYFPYCEERIEVGAIGKQYL